ncbi:GTP cyclohydrolase I [Nonomuraea sp. SBT364]|uniref:GTP cyclohydrolase I n=1 Tax=Nonomuraea sp. SBT364 TaxID=1580530 RepID=UPI00066E2C78|nr:GTP cyclohydrolase I [Nonomuraea sp. SBT364]
MDEILLDWCGKVLGPSSPGYAVLSRSIEENPSRIGNAYRDLLAGEQIEPLSLLKPVVRIEDGETHGLVEVKDIPFVSMCSHHFLPFFGTAAVAYLPGNTIIGLGKIPRLVDCLARRFQLQEILTKQIADLLMAGAGAQGTWASLTAQHLCMSHRGPGAVTSSTTTSYGVGVLAGRTC